MFNYKKNPIIFGTLLLSFSGLICRGIGFFYRSFISHSFGEEAMGIFQLTAPILMLAFSLTCAGIQTAISKYVASCLAVSNTLLAKKYLYCGCIISTALSLVYSIFVYLQAENISIYFLQEIRCATLLRISVFSFPFAALHACFNGYFYGSKETKIPSLTQIIEQFLRIGIVFLLYNYFISLGKKTTIALTCIGMLSGEVVSFAFSYLCYVIFSSKDSLSYHPNALSRPYFRCHDDSSSPPIWWIKKGRHFSIRDTPCSYLSNSDAGISPFPQTPGNLSIMGHLLSLAFPLTLNRVIVNLLQSYETVSIPAQLRSYGSSNETALSIYGVLTGMALSLVLFPSPFTNSASVLLLPSVSEAASQNLAHKIKKTIKQAIFFSCTLGFSCTAFFYLTGNFCGKLLFNSSLAGTFIRQLSFLCPFLYLHTTLSSILNGLKKTGATLFINLSGLGIRLIFTLYFIPIYGIQGYLWGLLLSELLSSLLCFYFLSLYFRYLPPT